MYAWYFKYKNDKTELFIKIVAFFPHELRWSSAKRHLPEN